MGMNKELLVFWKIFLARCCRAEGFAFFIFSGGKNFARAEKWWSLHLCMSVCRWRAEWCDKHSNKSYFSCPNSILFIICYSSIRQDYHTNFFLPFFSIIPHRKSSWKKSFDVGISREKIKGCSCTCNPKLSLPKNWNWSQKSELSWERKSTYWAIQFMLRTMKR